MASNRRRSLRKLSNYVNRIDRDVRNMAKRPSVTKLADRSVGTPQLEQGAVTTDILDETIVTDINDASTEAAAALSTANGKNKIYRQATEPTGGTYADGDLWFDTDDDNKMYRYSSTPSPVWTGFTLGNNALTNISANKITAGTIDASVITVSNINAGNIVAGTLTGISIVGVTIDIGGPDTTSFHVDVNGNMWIGGATYAAAPFKISSDGFVTSTNGATFSGSITSNGDARFGFGTLACYIQNDGRYQSLDGSTILSQMGPAGVITDAVNTNALNSRNQNYINMLGNFVGFRYNIGFGPCDDTYYSAFYATGNTASGNGFSATATRISDNFQYSWNYLQGVSDRRVKINIEEVSEDWEDKFLNQLKVWQFDKINFADDNDLHAYGKHLGVMADEIKEIFPQWETSYMLRDPDGADANTIRGVDYQSMIPALVWICQRFNARIKELEDRLSE